MNIDVSKMQVCWWEDENGNVLPEGCDRETKGAKFYHSTFPCQITHEIDDYDYHPEGFISKYLFQKSKLYKKWWCSRNNKTFRPLCSFNTTYGTKSSQECIVAMVNSGEYTLEQAIWVFTTACERCMNVLCHKYLNGKEGYEEYSDDWKQANTCCVFCEKGSEDLSTK